VSFGFAPQDAQTVQVRVQVIDMDPFALDLVVPTYIPARDLTVRVARDAGLGAYWEDGTRRQFWLRARGRLLGDEEKLQDLGVINGELLHLLPQPQPGSPVMERPPEYPANRGYSAAGWPHVVSSLVAMSLWAIGWTIVLTVNQGILTGLFPGLGLALLATSFARHLWGGEGSSIKVPLTGFVIYASLLVIAAVPAVAIAHASIPSLAIALAAAFLGGMFGIMLGWLAWYGAVEPLPKRVTQAAAAQQQVQLPNCGICALPVEPGVRADCIYRCGQVFHSGCYAARRAVAAADVCAVCGYRPA
jgi:uncharacterized ubiquitin-like protein YukD